ncbi:MAG: hypothetical protein HY401_04285 [Elusimicrobia bacterium]|nr:hypothetical protein [Elusimicrobiota bacterium]
MKTFIRALAIPMYLFALTSGKAFGHGGIYVTRAFTAYGLYTLIPSYGISKGDREFRIAGIYSWTEGANTDLVFENSDIKGNSASAGATWMIFNRLAIGVSGSVLKASGPEPLDPRFPSGAQSDVTAKGYTSAAAVSLYAVRRKHFQFSIIVGATTLWASADNNAQGQKGGYPDLWKDSGYITGFVPQFRYGPVSATLPLLNRHIKDTHEQLRGVIARGEHPKINDYVDSLHGLELTYDPWDLSFTYFNPSKGIQALGLKWAYRL